jgi:iron transport multicopper oxidase
MPTTGVSRLYLLLRVFFLLGIFTLSFGKHIKLDWKIGYMCGSPDGVRVCHILGVNGQFPGPTIEATIGDTLQVTVRNQIEDEEGPQKTAIHWYGIFQRGTPHEDGPEMVGGCPIPYNASYTYKFKLEQAGTYW